MNSIFIFNGVCTCHMNVISMSLSTYVHPVTAHLNLFTTLPMFSTNYNDYTHSICWQVKKQQLPKSFPTTDSRFSTLHYSNFGFQTFYLINFSFKKCIKYDKMERK